AGAAAPADVKAHPDAGRAIATPLNPFDPASLRLSQDYANLGVTKVLTTVPVRKPDKSWFVRTHPSPAYRLDTFVIELTEAPGGETYLVAQPLWPELATTEVNFSPRALFTAVSRQGTVFLWPIKLPGPDGRIDTWNESALEAARRAADRWVRVTACSAGGFY